MAQISLHDYLQQIETLLEENRLSEAIAHCRHILKKFPWHVDTYRLYGKALLEQQKYDDAVDIFRRVLSADPEDFISHVGLAITHKEKEEVPEAIWHMERAFEMDPYNGAIQEELRGLYANRDGLRPERINLTRGALARLYFRGDLYQQAASELRQLLSKHEDRIDLQTLFAETLWRDDQRVDVVDVCLRILDELPNCIKANAILAEVWLISGRNDEAQEYLQRLRMLTRPEKAYLEPDSVIARAFSATNGTGDIPDRTFIEELDYFPVVQELSGDADWVKEFGDKSESDEEANWLDEMGDVEADLFAEAAESDEDMLDWLREVAVAEEDSLEESSQGLETNLLTGLEDEQSQETVETETEPSDDLPDWLSEVTASAEADIWNAAIEEEDLESVRENDSNESGDNIIMAETPDWIRDVAFENANSERDLSSPEEDVPGISADDDEIPDWMRGSTDEADVFPDWLNESGELVTSERDDLPEWLTESEEETAVEESFPDLTLDAAVYEVSGEELPDWLLGSAEHSDADVDTTPGSSFETDSEDLIEGVAAESVFEPGADDLPAWLMDEEELTEMEATAEQDSLPDWLLADSDDNSGLDATIAESGLEGQSDIEEPEETADWLADFDETENADEELPDWLEESPDLIVGQTDIDQETLPDWLEGDDQEGMVREELLMGNSEDSEKNEPDIPEDLDEAMKWLEELAAEQGADLAELPSLQTEQPAEEAEIAAESGAVEADDVPDWLKADLSEGDLSTEEDLPDWLKDEAASISDADWLNLSGEDDQSELDMDRTVLESDNIDLDSPAQPSDDIPEWLKAQMPEDLQNEVGDGDADEDLGWLDQIAAGEGAPIEEPPTLSWGDDPVESGLDIESDDLSWLDEMSEVAGLPEQAETESVAESADETLAQVPDDPDEAMAWLEQLAAQQGAALDELPTVIDEVPVSSDADTIIDEAEIPEIDLEAMTVLDLPEEDLEVVSEVEVPEDPDEAMAWLEQLAAQQGAALDELPTVVDMPDTEVVVDVDSSEMPTAVDMPEVVEEEVVSEEEVDADGFDIPDDPDDAMAWLEQLAAKQGASLDELPTVDVVEEAPTPVTGIEDVEPEIEELAEAISDAVVIEEIPTPVTGIEMVHSELEPDIESEVDLETESDSEFEMALAELSDVDMPEDDDEALAWLAAIAGGGAVVADVEEAELDATDTAVFEAPEDAIEHTAIEFSPVEEAEIELESKSDTAVFEVPEEAIEHTDIKFSQVDEVELFEEEESVPTQIEMAVDRENEVEEESLFDTIEDETDQFITQPNDALDSISTDFEDEDLAEALPDWLQFAPMGETKQEGLDWLDSFGESEADSWLEAEEQISQAGLSSVPPAAEADPVAFDEPEPSPEPEVVEAVEAEEAEDFSDVILAQTGPLNPVQVESARTALEIGDYDSALDAYKSLLESEEQNLPLLIAELETESAKHAKVGGLQRLLGDAYMQNGQLQKAIDTYRQALDNL